MILSGDRLGEGGVSDRVARGSRIYVLCLEPEAQKQFVWVPGQEDRRPG